MRETLKEVLEDELRQAEVLKHNDHDHDAKLIKRICKRVSDATEDYLTFLNEPEAVLRTGRTVEFLRARFGGWERRGHAKRVGRVRSYREIILDSRVDLGRIRADARAAARMESAAPGATND
jgi:hypothetical protein